MSTWGRAVPSTVSAARAVVLDGLAAQVEAFGRRRVLVGVDGRTAAGKTTLGHQLADRLAGRGRVVLRSSLDDFKRPWSEAHLYDRESGEGYYRNAFDLEAVVRLLLAPARGGRGQVALCSIDPLTQRDHSARLVSMPDDAVVVVDGVFALRPELVAYWDLRVWVQVDVETSFRRGVVRDTARLGAHEAEALHRGRYQAAEAIYIDAVQPVCRADVIIDNTDLTRPRLTPS